MRFRLQRCNLVLAVGIGLVGLAWRVTPAVAIGSEVGFLAANDAAMNKMMADMTIKPTADIDRDFVAMMVPHHQGAIDMAQAELLYGHNQTLLRVARQIVVEQQQEIAAMRLADGEPASPSWVTEATKTLPEAVAPARKSKSGQEAPYLNGANAAIDRMMTDMTVKPSCQLSSQRLARPGAPNARSRQRTPFDEVRVRSGPHTGSEAHPGLPPECSACIKQHRKST